MKKLLILIFIFSLGVCCLAGCGLTDISSQVNDLVSDSSKESTSKSTEIVFNSPISFTQIELEGKYEGENQILQSASDRDEFVATLTKTSHIDGLNAISSETFETKTVLVLPRRDNNIYEKDSVKEIELVDGVLNIKRVACRDAYAEAIHEFLLVIIMDKTEGINEINITLKHISELV